MQITFRHRSHRSNSSGLLVFLQLLKEKHPNWVDFPTIEKTLPGISPRQMARFIDVLEQANFPLVSYETKTRGRYRLAVLPDELGLNCGMRFNSNHETPGLNNLKTDNLGSASLNVYINDAWLKWTIGLVYARESLRDSNIFDDDGAIFYLDKAEEAATGNLPEWATSVVYVRQAHALMNASNYREALLCLRRVFTLARHKKAHPGAKHMAQLIYAKIHHDLGRSLDSGHLFDPIHTSLPLNWPYQLYLKSLQIEQKMHISTAL